MTASEIRGENCRAQQVRAASPDHQGGTGPQLHGSRLFGRAVCREYASDIMLSHVCLCAQTHTFYCGNGKEKKKSIVLIKGLKVCSQVSI